MPTFMLMQYLSRPAITKRQVSAATATMEATPIA